MALDDDSFRDARGRWLEAKLKLSLFAGNEYYAVRSPRLQAKVRRLLADSEATERDWETVVREVEELLAADQASPVRPTLPAPADNNLTDADRPGNETGSAGNRPAWGRDHLFLKWNREGLKPAAIRDRWNDLSDSERKTICPECWEQLTGTSESTRDLIKKAIAKAKGELPTI